MIYHPFCWGLSIGRGALIFGYCYSIMSKSNTKVLGIHTTQYFGIAFTHITIPVSECKGHVSLL